jgi:hypothetical protein
MFKCLIQMIGNDQYTSINSKDSMILIFDWFIFIEMSNLIHMSDSGEVLYINSIPSDG